MSNDPAALPGAIAAFNSAVDQWFNQRSGIAIREATDAQIYGLDARTGVYHHPPENYGEERLAMQGALADRRNEIIRTGKELVPLLVARGEDSLAVAVQAVADAASDRNPSHIEQTRGDVKARLRVLAVKFGAAPANEPPTPNATTTAALPDPNNVVLVMLAQRYLDGSTVVDWHPVERALLGAGHPVLQERRLIRQTLNALTLLGAVEPIHKPPRPHDPRQRVFFADANEPDQWRILPHVATLARVRCQEAPQTDDRGRGADDLRLDADRPHYRAGIGTSAADVEGKTEPLKKADPGQPSLDRQGDIISTIRAAQMPLTRPELRDKMKMKREGKLGANLAWMVSNNILINIPNRGYWPAGEKVPE